MSRRAQLVLVTVVVLGVAGAWRLWPRHLSDEDQIRALIAEVARKAGEKDVSGVMEHVADGYRGEGGDKQELKAMLLGYFLRSGVVAVLPSNLQFVEPPVAGRARITFVVALARTPAKTVEEIPPEQLVGSQKIEAALSREGSTWRVTKAERSQAGVVDWVP